MNFESSKFESEAGKNIVAHNVQMEQLIIRYSWSSELQAQYREMSVAKIACTLSQETWHVDQGWKMASKKPTF